MKAFRYAAVLLFIALPSAAFAQSVPAFPMAFWGNVTINGSPAPIGTAVNAYYGSILAGSVIVKDVGVYGYTDPTQQKLTVGEGTGTISFTIQSSQFNGGVETGGTNQPTYSQFSSGVTLENDLAFTIPAPPTTGSGGSGGGGGGDGSSPVTTTSSGSGGGGSVLTSNVTSQANIPLTTTNIPVGAPEITPGHVLGANTYSFTRLLRRGSTGQDVMELQKVLIAAGFLKIQTPTTYFRAQTEAALKEYQTAHDLEAVGYTGPKTRTLLNQGILPTTPATAAISNSMTDAQRQSLIQKLQMELQVLLAQIAALQSEATSTATSTVSK